MQASSRWQPPTGTLGRIVAEAYDRARALEARDAELWRAAERAAPGPSFAGALRGDSIAVIAEVKRRSPSKGDIAPGLAALEQARAYERGGASAISVLTEPSHFGGSAEDLVAVRSGVGVPVLRKDFIVSRLQVAEAAALGASAVLLIARALDPESMRALAADAREVGLETLIEVRDEEELDRAVAAGASAIGVNNRNLETLEIHQATSLHLLPLVPAEIPAVAESGLRTREDVEQVADAGADAILIGSAVSAASDPTGAVRELAAVPRRGRG